MPFHGPKMDSIEIWRTMQKIILTAANLIMSLALIMIFLEVIIKMIISDLDIGDVMMKFLAKNFGFGLCQGLEVSGKIYLPIQTGNI